MRVKEESEKAGLKLNIQKTKIRASSSITSWQIDGGKMETVAGFIFSCSKAGAPKQGSKITVNGDCSHEIKSRLLFGRIAMIKQRIKNQRQHFVDKDPSNQSYGSSSSHVWM